jgi:hypothetical protein
MGKIAPLKNMTFAARRIALRRRDNAGGCGSSARAGGTQTPASHSANPLSASPQREQNRISSEICC